MHLCDGNTSDLERNADILLTRITAQSVQDHSEEVRKNGCDYNSQVFCEHIVRLLEVCDSSEPVYSQG